MHSRFLAFIRYCTNFNLEPAIFYTATKELFQQKDIQTNLDTLLAQSHTHLPSYFALLTFRGIYRPFSWDTTVQQMQNFMIPYHHRQVLPSLINLLARLYGNVVDYLMPIHSVCRKGVNSGLLNRTGWPPSFAEVSGTICADAFGPGILFSPANRFSVEDIFKSKCAYCTMQIVLYKVCVDSYY